MLQVPQARFFSEFGRSWLATWAVVRLKNSALREYESVMRLHLVPRFGEDQLVDITPERVQAWVAEMIACNCAPSTARNRVIILKRVLQTAVEYGLIAENPVQLAAFPRVERREMHFLEPPEICRLIDSTPPAWKLTIALAALCGLRAGEIKSLEWTDLNTEAMTVSVSKSMRNGIATSTKTPSSRSLIPMPESLRPLIEARRGQAGEHQLVFCKSDGGPLSDSTLGRVLDRALEAAGLPHIRFHDLRHSWAVAHIQAGTDLRTLSHLGRWASPQSLLETYAHVIGIGGDAVRRFDEFMSQDK